MTKTVPVMEGVQPGRESYSQVVEAGGLVFLAGQVGSVSGRPETYPASFEAEVRATFASAARLLAGVGLGLEDVVRCVVHLTDLADFAAMDAVFREVFPADPPVRATVGVTGLARDCRIEIEITASR